jgi:hypothetical protein
MKKVIRKIPFIEQMYVGQKMLKDATYLQARELTELEKQKKPTRTELINYILSKRNDKTTYLEIGVRNPNDNFNHIKASEKYSVDPGVEFTENPVDFQLTSDAFFHQLDQGKVLDPSIRFDVVFIDGLHLAAQVDRDISNALRYLKEDGFIVMHDCNPPTEWHARESYEYHHTPAKQMWNGTTWKAFVRWRTIDAVSACCVDTDWGLGVISKSCDFGPNLSLGNPYFEYKDLQVDRKNYLNLLSFDQFKSKI